MSVERTVAPDVRPVDRGIYRISERRERAPKQPFPEESEPDRRKREPGRDSRSDSDAPDGERRIDIRV